MLGDTLFRVINIAGGLGLDHDLWRREMLAVAPAKVRSGAIRRRIEAALAGGEAASLRDGVEPGRPALCRTPG